GDPIYSELAAFPDPLFDPIFGDGLTRAVATQPDGKILIGGSFTSINGLARTSLARLNDDGSIDESFQPTISTGTAARANIETIVVQPDGKVLIGGTFAMVNGELVFPNVARLHSDGTTDTTFDVPTVFGSGPVTGLGLQKDGKIILSGFLINLDGDTRYRRIGRLNSDGSLDSSFNSAISEVEAGPNFRADTILVQEDGKILIGGDFFQYNGVGRQGLARLNANGSLDTSFVPAVERPNTIAIQPDGKILVSGNQSGSGSIEIFRLESNGSLDPSFQVPEVTIAESIAIQSDGKILIVGSFPNVDGVARPGIARLEADGTLDSSFDPPPSPVVRNLVGMTLAENGNAILVGNIDEGGSNFVGVVQQISAGTATRALLRPVPGTLEWSRSEAAPSVSCATFEVSDDGGLTWNQLGQGTPITSGGSGWRLTGANLPAAGLVRAEGRTTGGQENASAGRSRQVETIPTPGIPVPDVTNPTSSDFMLTSALAGGEITDAGGQPILERGVVLSRTAVNEDPKFGGPEVITFAAAGTALGSFTVTLSDLVPETSYSFAAFARTAVGVGYSEVAQLRTLGLPIINTPTVSGISSTGATLGATVDDENGSPVTERGVMVYPFGATAEEKRLIAANDYQQTVESGGSGAGTFTVQVTGLLPDTTYTHVAYAVNDTGRAFTEEPSVFTTASAQPSPQFLPEEGNGPEDPLGNPFPNGRNTTSRSGTGPSSLLDTFYTPELHPGGFVQAIAIQPNNQAIVAGFFALQGEKYNTNIARLNNFGGGYDRSFVAETSDPVYSAIVQPDGKILIGGAFIYVNGRACRGIARLQSDGSLDDLEDFFSNPGADNAVYTLALQPDGKILAGGLFEGFQGGSRNRIARLLDDGRLDESFDPGSGADNAVFCISVQGDGKILIAGDFENYNGSSINRIARLNPDGTLDSSFNPGTGANARITGLAVQPDGRIILCGAFQSIDGTSVGRIARLNSDGSVDSSFDPGTGADDEVVTISMQTDGKVLIGGLFQNVNGSSCKRVARLNSDGSLDSSFDVGAGADNEVAAIALQGDGSVLLGGLFGDFDGNSKNGVVKFLNDPATNSLQVLNGRTMQWLRDGSSPEVLPPLFEVSTDGGTTWTELDKASRISGGWQLGGQVLPVSGLVRATGQTSGGYLGGSSGIVRGAVAFDHTAFINALRAQQTATLAQISKTKRKVKKLKKRKKRKRARALNRKVRNLNATSASIAAQLSLYP
ncbi:MAG: delta-60 repeat domain-containing protein, partial [Verrucomicrobiota bacterium]